MKFVIVSFLTLFLIHPVFGASIPGSSEVLSASSAVCGPVINSVSGLQGTVHEVRNGLLVEKYIKLDAPASSGTCDFEYIESCYPGTSATNFHSSDYINGFNGGDRVTFGSAYVHAKKRVEDGKIFYSLNNCGTFQMGPETYFSGVIIPLDNRKYIKLNSSYTYTDFNGATKTGTDFYCYDFLGLNENSLYAGKSVEVIFQAIKENNVQIDVDYDYFTNEYNVGEWMPAFDNCIVRESSAAQCSPNQRMVGGSCTDCPVGSFAATDVHGLSTCNYCEAGYYKTDGGGDNTCYACPEFKVLEQTGAISNLVTSPDFALGASSCVVPSGEYSDETGDFTLSGNCIAAP